MKKLLFGFLFIYLLPMQVWAFCGFYVAKADSSLFNESSQVVYVRDGQKNIVTMASDYKGKAKDFAMVVPVPTVLKRNQIKVINPAVVKHLDDYSAPRLAEYFDGNPCQVARPRPVIRPVMVMEASPRSRANALGVKIEAKYTVGEYDILLLSAQQSGGLVTWLTEQGYKLPQGAKPVINSYLKQNMKFFVAKVNLKKFDQSGYAKLRPIQIAYDYRRFMLPIRLGTVNAKGKQELFVYALTRKGRVETTNYRTVKLPSDIEIPTFIKNKGEFAKFYRDMFRYQTRRQGNKAVFLEYAWDMNWCDPCAADPLSDKELKELGVFWVKEQTNTDSWRGNARDVFITRLHVRYDRHHFPEDLMFQVTGDRENFQGRYVLRHAWKPTEEEKKNLCPAGKRYLDIVLPERQANDAKRLANLTGRDINKIRAKIEK